MAFSGDRRMGKFTHPQNGEIFSVSKKPARLSGPSLLVTCRYCSFGRAALWDFCHPCQEPDSADPVSARRPAADQASDPALDSVGRVGFGSSCCFLSWEHHNNGSESAPFRQFALHPTIYVRLTYSSLRPSLIGCVTSQRTLQFRYHHMNTQ